MSAFDDAGVPDWLLQQIYNEDDDPTNYDAVIAQRLQCEFNQLASEQTIADLARQQDQPVRASRSPVIRFDEANGAVFFPQIKPVVLAPPRPTQPSPADLERQQMMREQEAALAKAMAEDLARQQQELRRQARLAPPMFEFDVGTAVPTDIYTIRFRCPNGTTHGPISVHRLEKVGVLHQLIRHHLGVTNDLLFRFPLSPIISQPLDTPIQDIVDMAPRSVINVSFADEPV